MQKTNVDVIVLKQIFKKIHNLFKTLYAHINIYHINNNNNNNNDNNNNSP